MTVASQRDKDNRIRHLAYQLAAQLPEEMSEALAVLAVTRALLLAEINPAASAPILKLVDRPR